MMEEIIKALFRSHKGLSILFAVITLFALYMGSPLAALPAMVLMVYYFIQALYGAQRILSGQAKSLRESREKLHAELLEAHIVALRKLEKASRAEREAVFERLVEAGRLSGKDDLSSIARARAIVAEAFHGLTSPYARR